jgi:hypothetical protein
MQTPSVSAAARQAQLPCQPPRHLVVNQAGNQASVCGRQSEAESATFLAPGSSPTMPRPVLIIVFVVIIARPSAIGRFRCATPVSLNGRGRLLVEPTETGIARPSHATSFAIMDHFTAPPHKTHLYEHHHSNAAGAEWSGNMVAWWWMLVALLLVIPLRTFGCWSYRL